MSSSQAGDPVSMVHMNTPEHSSISKEVVHHAKDARIQDVERKTLALIENTLEGDALSLEESIAQVKPTKKRELELMAQIIVSRALNEAHHCKACVSLACVLHAMLPSIPAARHMKAESFMHALLDVFQTEFEKLFGSPSTTQRNEKRIRAIVQFAGHLYCHRLLGNGVVSQIVQDLVDNGESAFANELLWFVGTATNSCNSDCGNLGTVLEDPNDSDGASSESVSQPAIAHHDRELSPNRKHFCTDQ